MTTSLNALAMVVGMNTDQVTAGVGSIRQQLGRANRIMQMSKTPADKLQEGITALSIAHQKGAITADRHAKGLRFLQEKYGQTSKAANQTSMELLSQLPLVGSVTARMGMFSTRVYASAAALGSLSAAAVVVAAPLAVVVAGVASAVIAFRGLVAATRSTMDEMERLDPTIKASTAIGALVGDVQGLQYAFGQMAGVGAEQTIQALRQLQRRIGETAAGVGEAKIAFQALGLSAQQLATMSPTKQLEETAKALAGVQNRTQQAYIASKLFGEELGSKLLPALTANSAEWQAAQARVESFGITLTQVQAKSIETANDSLQDLNLLVQGFKTQTAGEFAPLFSAVAQSLTQDILPQAGTMRMQFRLAADSTSFMLGNLTDIANIVAGIAEMKLWDVGSGWDRLTSGLGFEATDKLRERLLAARQAARESQSLPEMDGGQIAEAAAKAESLLQTFTEQRTQLHLQVVALREGEDVARRLKYQQDGYNANQIMQLEHQNRIIKQLEEEEERRDKLAKKAEKALKDEQKRLDDLAKAGQSVRDSIRTPFETAADEIARLTMLLRGGFIDSDTFARARDKEVEKASEKAVSTAPSAIRAGSIEAYKFVVDATRKSQDKQLREMEKQRVIQELQLAQQERFNEQLARLETVGLL